MTNLKLNNFEMTNVNFYLWRFKIATATLTY